MHNYAQLCIISPWLA